jgi:hypothetical protein
VGIFELFVRQLTGRSAFGQSGLPLGQGNVGTFELFPKLRIAAMAYAEDQRLFDLGFGVGESRSICEEALRSIIALPYARMMREDCDSVRGSLLARSPELEKRRASTLTMSPRGHVLCREDRHTRYSRTCCIHDSGTSHVVPFKSNRSPSRLWAGQ